MCTRNNFFKDVAILIVVIFTSFESSPTIAQITPDSTLPINSRVKTVNNITIVYDGTKAGRNLYHSFEQFSIPTGQTADFENYADVQNIISRVTGKSISNIDGSIRASGTANLFLINPNGIIFGQDATLNIGGSFIASTADRLNFADGTFFSATKTQATPLLSISTPIGLQFGTTAAPIRSSSQASPENAMNFLGTPIGLVVQQGKTLALIGGDITIESGNLTAPGGRIEIGSVAPSSLVNLSQTNKDWVFEYSNVTNFQNIQISTNTGYSPSIVDTSSFKSGNIKLQGSNVELIGSSVSLVTANQGEQQGGDIIVNANKLFVKNGAQVFTSAFDKGAGGNLTVNATESVEISGSLNSASGITSPSAILSTTYATGKAGNITINTRRFKVSSGAEISTQSEGLIFSETKQFVPAAGDGGNLTVNASESIELIGNSTISSKNTALLTGTNGFGNAGNLSLVTKQLTIQDGATATVSSQIPNNLIYLGDTNKLGAAGNLKVQAHRIILDNQGKLTSETDLYRGGNITLLVRDLLLMRNNSQISTSAGKAQAIGDGGNIIIDAPTGFIVAPIRENNDITANAFSGNGGRVKINAISIFGIAPLSREDLAKKLEINDTIPSLLDPTKLPTSDITAISQVNSNLNGVININTIDTNINRGLTNLPTKLVEAKIVQACKKSNSVENQSKFTIVGRSGLPYKPFEPMRSNTTLEVAWVSNDKNHDGKYRNVQSYKPSVSNINSTSPYPNQIVEAQSWVRSPNGEVYLVASTPTNIANIEHFLKAPSRSCI